MAHGFDWDAWVIQEDHVAVDVCGALGDRAAAVDGPSLRSRDLLLLVEPLLEPVGDADVGDVWRRRRQDFGRRAAWRRAIRTTDAEDIRPLRYRQRHPEGASLNAKRTHRFRPRSPDRGQKARNQRDSAGDRKCSNIGGRICGFYSEQQ